MREEKISFKEKIFRHHITKIYRIALVVILVITVIAAIQISIKNKVYSTYESAKELEPIGASDSVFEPYNNGNLLCYSKDGISAYNQKGSQLWNQTYEMQSPIVDQNGEYVVAGDYKGNIIYIMNGTGNTATITCNKIILDLKVSAGGIVMATLDDDHVTWIELYNGDGSLMVSVKTSMEQTGFPFVATMSSDNRKMAVSYLKTKGNGVGTSIAFYNFGDVGQNVSDKIVSGFDYSGQVIPFLHYINENEAVAVGENKLLVFYGKQIPELRQEIEIESDVLGVYYSDKYVGLVYKNADGEEKYRLNLYDTNASLVLSQPFNMEYNDIIISDTGILIYNEGEVLIVNPSGLVKYNGDMGGKIKAIIPIGSDHKYLVIRDSSVEIIKLK